ncbi:MAG TPA: phage tail protein, partial [Acidimicrobiales bacterium]|nr:phage tail protein [Acidimicrobiales bacterium]
SLIGNLGNLKNGLSASAGLGNPNLDPAISVFFEISIDQNLLGAWSKCSGLGVELEVDSRTDGGMGLFMHQLTGRFKYTNLQLSRPICAETSMVMAWLSTFTVLNAGTTASITALDPAGKTIISWDLHGVVPVRWTGPEYDINNLQVATETLELAYQGFL